MRTEPSKGRVAVFVVLVLAVVVVLASILYFAPWVPRGYDRAGAQRYIASDMSSTFFAGEVYVGSFTPGGKDESVEDAFQAIRDYNGEQLAKISDAESGDELEFRQCGFNHGGEKSSHKLRFNDDNTMDLVFQSGTEESVIRHFPAVAFAS